MRLALLLTIPSTIGLMMLARPIISVIYEHGRFTATMTEQTALALQYYAIGLAAYSALKVLTPAFYAIDRRKTPMMVSFLSIAMNLLLNWFFTFHLKLAHRGLALSTGLVAMMNFAILYLLMRRHVRGLETRTMAVALAKLAVASGVLALVCLAAQTFLFVDLSQMRFLAKTCALFVTIGIGATLFFATAYLLKIDEVQDLTHMLARRFSRK
jgi:putative peptidoglycan lipid II flippase